jgi:hypothetical protein
MSGFLITFGCFGIQSRKRNTAQDGLFAACLYIDDDDDDDDGLIFHRFYASRTLPITRLFSK